MLLFSYYLASFHRGPVQAMAIRAVSFSWSDVGVQEPPPWPLVIVLPLITGLSITLWAGIGRLFGMLIAN